jgi:succinylarginine dihydrolase
MPKINSYTKKKSRLTTVRYPQYVKSYGFSRQTIKKEMNKRMHLVKPIKIPDKNTRYASYQKLNNKNNYIINLRIK